LREIDTGENSSTIDTSAAEPQKYYRIKLTYQ